jgi:branched-chain amino acid transport system ATP-binding protein
MTSTPGIAAKGLWAGYDGLAAVRDLSLEVGEGELVALLGPNGAGKTTTLLALAGAIRPMQGEVLWFGKAARGAVHERVRKGMGLVPEQKAVVSRLSVRDNLLLSPNGLAATKIFPELEGLLYRQAGLLSGGEQQMLTLGRALAARPTVLLIDELSLGLAPLVVSRLFQAVTAAARDDGVAVLLVEQQARRARTVADRWYLLRHGHLEASGDGDTNADNDWDTQVLYGARTDNPRYVDQ